MSVYSQFVISVIHKFPDKNDIYLNFIAGSIAVLPCQPPKSVPAATVYYEHNGHPLKSDGKSYWHLYEDCLVVELLFIIEFNALVGLYQDMAILVQEENPDFLASRPDGPLSLLTHAVDTQGLSCHSPNNQIREKSDLVNFLHFHLLIFFLQFVLNCINVM